MKHSIFLIALVLLSSLLVGCTALKSKTYHIDAASGVNVRATPSESGRILGTLPNEETVTVVEIREDGWTEIDYSGKQGYVKSTYVKEGLRLWQMALIVGILLLFGGGAKVIHYKKDGTLDRRYK